MTRYIIQKTSIKKGKGSCIPAGGEADGTLIIGRPNEGTTEIIEKCGLMDIQVDDVIYVGSDFSYNFIKTSQISQILEQTEDRIEIVTETSVYTVFKREDDS